MNIKADMALSRALDALREAEKALEGQPEREAVAKLAQCINAMHRDRGFAAPTVKKLGPWSWDLQLRVPRVRVGPREPR